MARKAPRPPDPSTRGASFLDELVEEIEAGAGAPQEILPAEVRAEIPVYAPVMTRVDRMVPTSWNTNEESVEMFHELLEDIRKDGFTGAVDVVPFKGGDGEESYEIVHGEHRWRAAKLLGIPEIPASHLRHPKFADEDFRRILSVRRNNIHGRHNKQKLRALIEDLTKRNPDHEALRKLLVFTRAEEWAKLVGTTREGLKKQGATPEMMRAFDEKAKNARGLADLSVIVSRLFELYKDTVPWGFMVFTYGKEEHHYIAGTKATIKHLKRVLDYCASNKTEVNTVLGPAFERLATDLEARVHGPVDPDDAF